jgi:hypothetical protein
MGIPHQTTRRLPFGLKLAAVFLILYGVYDWIPLVGSGVGSGPIGAPSSYIAGRIAGKLLYAALCVTAGVAILYRRAFGRILGLILLVIAVPGGVLNFAYGLAHGIGETQPTPAVWVASAFVIIGWYGTFSYLLLRKSSRDALRMGTPISNPTESERSRTPRSTHEGPQ